VAELLVQVRHERDRAGPLESRDPTSAPISLRQVLGIALDVLYDLLAIGSWA